MEGGIGVMRRGRRRNIVEIEKKRWDRKGYEIGKKRHGEEEMKEGNCGGRGEERTRQEGGRAEGRNRRRMGEKKEK
jgi:hypothetical protein